MNLQRGILIAVIFRCSQFEWLFFFARWNIATRVLVKLFYSISIFHIKTAIDLYYIQCIVSKQNIYLYFHILYLIWINSHSKRTKIGRIPCEHNVIPNKVEVFWFRSWLLNLKASNRFIESCGISIRIRAFIKRQNGMEWAV